jgi:hypothetical protein
VRFQRRTRATLEAAIHAGELAIQAVRQADGNLLPDCKDGQFDASHGRRYDCAACRRVREQLARMIEVMRQQQDRLKADLMARDDIKAELGRRARDQAKGKAGRHG